MGRRRKAWLWGGNGKRVDRGRALPGYYCRFYDYADGRRITRSKHFTKQAHAKEWVKRYNARLDLKEIGQVVPISLREASQEFIAGCSSLAFDTTTHYASALGMLHGVIGDLDVKDIAAAHIDRFIAGRLKISRPSTTAKHLRGLSRFFNWAIARGYAAFNPVADVTSRPRGDNVRERPPVSDDQLAALIAALDTPDRRLAVWLALTTGLDRGVVHRLTPAQVDLDAKCIRFKRPKTNKVNVVPVHAALVPLLAEKLRQIDPSAPLFAGLARETKDRDWWHIACRKAGVPGLLFRDLRAVATSRLLRTPGASLPDAQRLLGHASAETTARHYLIPDPDVAARLSSLALPGFLTPPAQTTD